MVAQNTTTQSKKTNKEEKVMESKKVIKGAKSVKASKSVKAPKQETKKEVKSNAIQPEVKVEEKKDVKKENSKKQTVAVPQLKNSELAKLFIDNGCRTKTKANDTSNVVYNTFGTESRVLQQKKAYQLLLTNGHDMKKGVVVEAENDDVARFKTWYETLSEEQKSYINGFDTITATKLATSEMPRERTVKIVSYDLLVDFIKYMGTFEENQMAVAK